MAACVPRLRRSSLSDPGLARVRHGKGFSYHDARGATIRDTATLERIHELAIPPAWHGVWICTVPNGHLQAAGTDAAGRRQYLYHPAWRVHRDRIKFEHALDFGASLPRLRRRIRARIAGEELSRERVLAAAVRLLDLGLFRVGSDEYAEEHASHGLATLEKSHVHVSDGAVCFRYVGKAGKTQTHRVADLELVRIAAQLLRRRGAGQAFLAYRGERGWSRVHAADVNAAVKELTGGDFSAKDFRTWHATVLAALGLAAKGAAQSEHARRAAVNDVIREVAAELGNTPAVCRASYVDHRVLDRYRGGETIPVPRGDPAEPRVRERIERAVLRLLRG